MRSVLRGLSLLFSVSVLSGLTYRAGTEGGCRSNPSDRAGSSPQAVPQQVVADPKPPTVSPPNPTPPPVAKETPATTPHIPPDRFLGASKAAPVFLPSEVAKPAPTQAQQAPAAPQGK